MSLLCTNCKLFFDSIEFDDVALLTLQLWNAIGFKGNLPESALIFFWVFTFKILFWMKIYNVSITLQWNGNNMNFLNFILTMIKLRNKAKQIMSTSDNSFFIILNMIISFSRPKCYNNQIQSPNPIFRLRTWGEKREIFKQCNFAVYNHDMF